MAHDFEIPYKETENNENYFNTRLWVFAIQFRFSAGPKNESETSLLTFFGGEIGNFKVRISPFAQPSVFWGWFVFLDQGYQVASAGGGVDRC